MAGAYYNEHDPKAAAWLRELVKEELIADGEVDTRSITDVQPDELRGFAQCHFFAGIGGWSYALRLAGWPDDRPIWTGSCPCQPFSAAGSQAGGDDPRHLWPAWFQLIRECKPDVVFGEQVESAVSHGWLDLVCDDLEAEGYAVGAVGLPACSVGAPHIRQRLWFVADTERGAAERHGYQMGGAAGRTQGQTHERQRLRDDVGDGESVGELGDTSSEGLPEQRSGPGTPRGEDQADTGQATERAGSPVGTVGDAEGSHGRPGERGAEAGIGTHGERGRRSASARTEQLGHAGGGKRGQGIPTAEHATATITVAGVANPWADLTWLPCRDGKARPTQSSVLGIFDGLPSELGYVRDESGVTRLSPLVTKTTNRVMRLRGYGNAITIGVAVAFIECYMETLNAKSLQGEEGGREADVGASLHCGASPRQETGREA